jgi:hypothetical protein
LKALYPDVPWDDTTFHGRHVLACQKNAAQQAETERLQSLERQKAREERRKREPGNNFNVEE